MSVTATAPEQPPSLIETLRVEPGHQIPLLDHHLRRLQRSCRELGHPWPGDTALRDRFAQAVAALDPEHAWRLRLLLSPSGGVQLETGPLPAVSPPLKVVVQGPRMGGAEAWLQHKTTHRPWYREAADWLNDHPDIFDILYWNEDGWMSEGSRSNLYMQTPDGRWITPPLPAGVLPGTQRAALLERGQVSEAPIHRDAFLQATRRRISNGLRGWQDVVVVDFSA